MTQRDPLKTVISRIAALRVRGAYRLEKQRLLGETNDARRRGENLAEFLARLEVDALKVELLGRRR